MESNPYGFDLDVGTVERVEQIYADASGAWMQLGAPQDFAPRSAVCVPGLRGRTYRSGYVSLDLARLTGSELRVHPGADGCEHAVELGAELRLLAGERA